MIATERAGQWIFDQLSGDATLTAAVAGRFYRDLAPQRKTSGPDPYVPCVVFSSLSATDILANGGNSAGDEELWQVKAVDQGESPFGLIAIADRIYTALHRKMGTADGLSVNGCVRESTIPLPPEVDSGVRYVFVCQVFRLWIGPN